MLKNTKSRRDALDGMLTEICDTWGTMNVDGVFENGRPAKDFLALTDAIDLLLKELGDAK